MIKSQVLKTLDEFDDNVDLDAFLEKLYLLEKLDQGEQDIREGRTVDHADAKERFGRWLA